MSTKASSTEKVGFEGLLGAKSQSDLAKKVTPELSHDELNKAALLLVEALHDGIKANVMYNMDTSHAEPWQYICGLIVHCAEGAMLSCSVVDRNWMSSSPVFTGLAKCIQCGAEFKPLKRGIVFCSEECAREGTTLPSSNPDWRPRPKLVQPEAQLKSDVEPDEQLEAIEL